MKTHLARHTTNQQTGCHRTTSQCGRLHNACDDGMNITDDPREVTCGFCLKQLRKDAERADWIATRNHHPSYGRLNQLAQDLGTAWAKYMDIFGEPPHGTSKQIRAMLEFLPKSMPQKGLDDAQWKTCPNCGWMINPNRPDDHRCENVAVAPTPQKGVES